MEVNFVCDEGEDLSALLEEYPDLNQDENPEDGQQSWWVGQSSDECGHDESEWMTYEECAEFCGFAETLIDSGDTLVEGNGTWAQGELRKGEHYKKGVNLAMAHKEGGAE